MGAELTLGLDVGTQGTKALVIDLDARRVVARASSAYGLLPGLPPGTAEQHPDTWWKAVRACLGALAGSIDLARIGAVGVSGQQHGFVALDAERQVLRPAKLWCDTSTVAEARELSAALEVAVPTGYTASKILWLKRHEPQHFARLAHVLLPHDWINLRLTGTLAMEAGDASGTGFFDVRARRFDAAACAAIDPTLEARLPRLVAPDEPLGRLEPGVARELGLPAGIPVAPGGGDNMCAAIGAGATRPGLAVLSLGTSATVFAWSPTAVVDPAGSDGLLFLPYLQGERVPDLPEASGSLLGLRPGLLEPGHLFRAALEGVAQNLAWGVARMRGLGLALEHLRLVGGGARNALWARILADTLEVHVQRLGEDECAALGAALQAAWVLRGGSIDALAQSFVSFPEPALAPDAEGVRLQRAQGTRFRAALARLHPSAG